ncbi:MAG: DUF721 domain-containing protein [Lentisphaeria bacterium]|nr:DUF721 domain-containing protein [Lentisphaeria bacterium]
MKPPPAPDAPLPPRRHGLRRRRTELLTLWYGEERAAVEIAAHTVQPKSIGSLIDHELSRLHSPESSALIQLRTHWSELLGAGFSRFTEPLSLRDGVLTLKVRHSALLMELQPSQDLILKRIHSRFDIVTSIKFTV